MVIKWGFEMGIIEKLGIMPIERRIAGYYKHLLVCHSENVEELEQQRNELLEALIESTKVSINMYINHYGATKTTKQIEMMHTDNINIIQKADPKHRSWDEIKELL